MQTNQFFSQQGKSSFLAGAGLYAFPQKIQLDEKSSYNMESRYGRVKNVKSDKTSLLSKYIFLKIYLEILYKMSTLQEHKAHHAVLKPSVYCDWSL